MRSNCPVNIAVESFGDKWSLLIIRDLMFKEKRYYNEFFHSKEKISTSVLGDRLKQLENSGAISKGKDDTKKSRIKYSLTQKGIDMLPLLLEMIIWSNSHDNPAELDFLDDAIKDRQSYMAQMRNKLAKEHLE